MTNQRVIALALCRVSTPEQLQNNSLNRQEDAVERAAKELGAEIPKDGRWSGNVSSKRGTNINRADLNEMLDYCKRSGRVRYIIVDEVDRFMRSMLELAHFMIEFKKLGAEVVFASQPNLKTDTAANTLMLMLEAFKAEGSNEERQRKSISGQNKAGHDGRYTYCPKPGYMKGYIRGIHEIHPIRGPILQSILVKLAGHILTPDKALAELNASEFMRDHSPYKLDKFRKIATDPFYAGIVKINKQVKVYNEGGLHQTLITKEQHYELVRIMDAKKKTQGGPRKNGNPEYPGNNITICDSCLDKKNGRFVGFPHSNGKPNGRIYKKYRCRSCGVYLHREDMHREIEKQFKNNPLTEEGVRDFMEALSIVWKREENQAEQAARNLAHRIGSLRESIRRQVEDATDPSNASIKEEILEAIDIKKQEVERLEDELERLRTGADGDKEQFLRFALSFADDMSAQFLDPTLSQEDRLRCKQIIFPAGFYVDKNKRVYTPEKSVLITLASNKKARANDAQAHLVRVRGL